VVSVLVKNLVWLSKQPMLTEIIDTPGKNKLAAFFLQSQPRSFHPEEVRKSISEPGSVIAANLKHFVRKSFLSQVERNGEMYFRLNPRYPYLEELREYLVRKSPTKLRDTIWQDLEKLNGATVIVLSGLFTGQLQLPADIVFVGTTPPATLKKTLDKVEKEFRQELNYVVFTPEEFQMRHDMYDRFVRDLTENPHLIVIDKRSKVSKDKKIVPAKRRGRE
jgi:hypothetical protein